MQRVAFGVTLREWSLDSRQIEVKRSNAMIELSRNLKKFFKPKIGKICLALFLFFALPVYLSGACYEPFGMHYFVTNFYFFSIGAERNFDQIIRHPFFLSCFLLDVCLSYIVSCLAMFFCNKLWKKRL